VTSGEATNWIIEIPVTVDEGRGAGTRPRFDWVGFDREVRRHADGDVRGAGTPAAPEHGLSANALFDYQRTFTRYAANRLLTVGAAQYDEGASQKFEDMSIGVLIDGLREELADVINYATMIDIQMQRVAAQWEGMGA
jgi:hypothetical protein